MWMEGTHRCRMVPTTMWTKITYKNLVSFKHVGFFFIRLALLVLAGDSIWCPNVVAKLRSQKLSHMMPNLGKDFILFYLYFFKVTVVHSLTGWSLKKKKNEYTCCLLHRKGEISQNGLMWPLQL